MQWFGNQTYFIHNRTRETSKGETKTFLQILAVISPWSSLLVLLFHDASNVFSAWEAWAPSAVVDALCSLATSCLNMQDLTQKWCLDGSLCSKICMEFSALDGFPELLLSWARIHPIPSKRQALKMCSNNRLSGPFLVRKRCVIDEKATLFRPPKKVKLAC